jgi:uncharacterized membrane protein
MPTTTSTVHIHAKPSEVMTVLVEHERYPELFSHIQSVHVRTAEVDRWEVDYVTRVIRDLRYSLKLTRDGDKELSWTQLEGVFTRNEGVWRLTPSEGGTLVEYVLHIELAVFLPQAITRSLTGQALPQMLSRVKAEVERRFQSGS